MAKKDKYGKKPQVSPLTMVLVGLFFVGLILTIVLSVKTPKEKFNEKYGLDSKNSFALINQKKMEKLVNDGENVLVIINTKGSETDLTELIQTVNKAYNSESPFSGFEVVKESYTKIYFVEISAATDLADFFDGYKKQIKLKTTTPFMLAFKDKEFVAEYDASKNAETSPETAKLSRNVKDFFVSISEKLEK
ncbi:hypothetical protein [Haploplasma axanthum]|uniref:Uncharacterized protein n=1 Tax=Haploplasma axanthum TaxID=29552 RepID=A0A449BF43_HAPAX|nr:hypothetical protein [Haploplasma axanthum]VEU81067.1 Uncharacterised protein [Haploplasma axanthum]